MWLYLTRHMYRTVHCATTCSTRCCVVLVVMVAVLAYFGLQKTTVSFAVRTELRVWGQD